MSEVQPVVDGATKREKNRKPISAKWLLHIRTLERLLAAGTAGAFFFAIARNVPVHWAQRGWPPDPVFTTDRVLRYGFLLWFLAYLLSASVDRDQSARLRSRCDIAFDVIQSVAALSSAYFLGFVLPQRYQTGEAGFLAANSAILVICLVSWGLFQDSELDQDFQKKINGLRVQGAGVSGAAVVLSCLTIWVSRYWVFLLVLSQFGIWMILWTYIKERVNRLLVINPWYEVSGIESITNSDEIKIELTQEFREIVDAKTGYLVFVASANPGSQLSVKEHGATNFKVKRSGSATDITFAYRVVGRRKTDGSKT